MKVHLSYEAKKYLGELRMKKLMTMLLALSFLATTATLTFAADDKKPATDPKTSTKSKGKKKKKKPATTTETKTTPK
jgi:hypothetical protein